MDDATAAFKTHLARCLEMLEDPRVTGHCEHSLFDLVAITLLAVMSGAEDWTDIQEFGNRREPWLKTFLELPQGIPSDETFQRVFGLLRRDQFAECLFVWTQALNEATGGSVIVIDGKALRRSLRSQSGWGMLHLVSAWSSENGLTLGQVACKEQPAARKSRL